MPKPPFRSASSMSLHSSFRTGSSTTNAFTESRHSRGTSHSISIENFPGNDSSLIYSPPASAHQRSSSAFEYSSVSMSDLLDIYNGLRNRPFEQDGPQPTSISRLQTATPASSFEASPSIAPLPTFADTKNLGSSYDQELALAPSETATSSVYQLSLQQPLTPKEMIIFDLDLVPGVDASIIETGVSTDDIEKHIEPPDNEAHPAKFRCMFEDCGKLFGRKENIRSHIQTHLGDRQFRCNYCSKCFVRSHDLKRHAKIHSGIKPYKCVCGNAFARHDALTRHRKRNMCIGGEDGQHKIPAKRGRPRKRQELQKRQTKASRTRQRMKDREIGSSASSEVSADEFLSWSPEPPDDDDEYDFRSHCSTPINNTRPFLEGMCKRRLSEPGPSYAFLGFRDTTHPTPPSSPGSIATPCQSIPSSPASSLGSSPRKALLPFAPIPQRRIFSTILEEPMGPSLPAQNAQSSEDAERQYTTPPIEPSTNTPSLDTDGLFDFDAGSDVLANVFQSANNNIGALPSPAHMGASHEPSLSLQSSQDLLTTFAEGLTLTADLGNEMFPLDDLSDEMMLEDQIFPVPFDVQYSYDNNQAGTTHRT